MIGGEPVEPHDNFDQRRFVIAMVLSGIILLVWQVFFAPPPPDTVTRTSDEVAELADAPPTESPTQQTADGEPTKPVVPVADLDVIESTMKTGDFEVTLSSLGGRVVGVNVLQPEQYQAEGDLLESFPDDSEFFPFGLYFTKSSIPLRRGLVWQLVEAESKRDGDNYTKIVYRHVDPSGQFQVDKVFSVADFSYMLDLDVVITNHGASPINDRIALDITGFEDSNSDRSFLDMRPSGDEGICRMQDDIERELFNSIKTAEAFDESPITWGAISSHYFLFAAIPAKPALRCQLERVEGNVIRTRIVSDDFTVQPGATVTHKYQLWTGPKDYDQLGEVGGDGANFGLEEAVDFGILTFLARPLRWLLVKFYGLLGNWGLAIILLTFVIRLATWPINQKVYVNSEKMKEVQPLLQAIKEKYPDDQQRAAEETMKIWKEHGVSPLGCLPMFLQFPILLALYFMILNSVELYHAEFMLWYTDLSAPDPYFVLPILMGVAMIAQQRMMTPPDSGNEQMKQMQTIMKIMPVMFTVFMLFLPAGVVLYYFVSLLIGVAQQFMIKRMYQKKKAAVAGS